jgi:hypothetical protein
MDTEVVASVLPPPEAGKGAVVASTPSTSGQASGKAKPIVEDLTELMGLAIQTGFRVPAGKVVAFDKPTTIHEDDDSMSKSHPPTATDASILDHQEGEPHITIGEEDIKLLDRLPDETEPMDENKAEEDDSFDP